MIWIIVLIAFLAGFAARDQWKRNYSLHPGSEWCCWQSMLAPFTNGKIASTTLALAWLPFADNSRRRPQPNEDQAVPLGATDQYLLDV